MAGKKLGGIKEGKSPFSLGLFLPVKPYMQKTECAGSRRVGITPEQPSASLWVCLEGLQPDRGKKNSNQKKKKKNTRTAVPGTEMSPCFLDPISFQALSFFF